MLLAKDGLDLLILSAEITAWASTPSSGNWGLQRRTSHTLGKHCTYWACLHTFLSGVLEHICCEHFSFDSLAIPVGQVASTRNTGLDQHSEFTSHRVSFLSVHALSLGEPKDEKGHYRLLFCCYCLHTHVCALHACVRGPGDGNYVGQVLY